MGFGIHKCSPWCGRWMHTSAWRLYCGHSEHIGDCRRVRHETQLCSDWICQCWTSSRSSCCQSLQMSLVQFDSASVHARSQETWSRVVVKNPNPVLDRREFCTASKQVRLNYQSDLGLIWKLQPSTLNLNLTLLNTHTHTQPFYCSSGICPGPPGWAGTRKVNQEG